MCARLKQLPTGRRGRNKEERHRKLLICAPDCQSATGALHYRHEERSSASSNPSVLLITHALHVQTHTRVCACAQLPGNNADLLVESSTQALTLRQGEEEMNISRRDEEDTGSWSSRVTADTQPTVTLPACHLSAVFQPLLHTHTHTHLYQQPPSRFFVIECLHSPAR